MTERRKSYAEQLKDPRWQKKRLEVLSEREWMCELCQATDITLHVHHSYYDRNLSPWEYHNQTLQVLCQDCHSQIENDLALMREAIGRMHIGYCYPTQIIGYIEGCRMALFGGDAEITDGSFAEGLGHVFGIAPKAVIALADDNGRISAEDLAEVVMKGVPVEDLSLPLRLVLRHKV